MSDLCPDQRVGALVQAMQSDDADCLLLIDALLDEFSGDPRLHFMRGSYLIGAGRMIEGYDGLSRAVELAPDFAIARFQLGFFQLTSGEAENALATWGRLDLLPERHYLRKFVDGLRCLIRDEFAAAVEHLRAGMALNDENPPLNDDMQLIIERCGSLASKPAEASDVSETSLILSQFTRRPGGKD